MLKFKKDSFCKKIKESNKENLFRIRKEIEMDASEMRAILKDKDYVKYFEGKF